MGVRLIKVVAKQFILVTGLPVMIIDVIEKHRYYKL